MQRGQVFVRIMRSNSPVTVDAFDMSEVEFRSWLLDILNSAGAVVACKVPIPDDTYDGAGVRDFVASNNP